MSTLSELFEAAAKKEGSTCQGRVYRYTEAGFTGKRGRIALHQELRLQKKLSCPGCEKCGWQDDDLREGLACSGRGYLQFEPGLKSGDYVKLVLEVTGTDWETGHADEWHLKCVKHVPTAKA